MLYSIIDIGSNTVKSALFEVEGKSVKQVDFHTKQLGLIAKIEKGALPEYAISQLIDTINEYKSISNSKVYCFATESLRQVSNLDEIQERISTECGISTELISGKDEALLSFEGFLANADHINEGIMVDMGGGSTEILKFENRQAVELNSFKFGCLSLKRDFVKGRFPVSYEISAIESHVDGLMTSFPWIKNSKRLCLIGGTGSAIGKLAIELGFTTLPEFPRETFKLLFDYLSDMNDIKTALLEKYIPARVETIIPGICAYKRIIETVNAESVYISRGGIRDGFLRRKLRG